MWRDGGEVGKAMAGQHREPWVYAASRELRQSRIFLRLFDWALTTCERYVRTRVGRLHPEPRP
jgi:hypothetical protein